MMESNPLPTSTTYASSVTSTATKTTDKENKNELDSEDFLLLLMAQLKNQNPLEPMSDQEFMSQMTQLNTLNVLKSIDTSTKALNTNSELSNAASMIGKTVEYTGDDDLTATGVVASITYEDGAVFLQIGDKSIPLEDVTRVTASA